MIPNVDLDGDGLLDEMRFDCPGAGSSQPGDPCEAEIRFGGGQRLELSENVLLVLHRGTYYAIKGDVYAGRPRGGGTAYRITRTALRPVCTNL